MYNPSGMRPQFSPRPPGSSPSPSSSATSSTQIVQPDKMDPDQPPHQLQAMEKAIGLQTVQAPYQVYQTSSGAIYSTNHDIPRMSQAVHYDSNQVNQLQRQQIQMQSVPQLIQIHDMHGMHHVQDSPLHFFQGAPVSFQNNGQAQRAEDVHRASYPYSNFNAFVNPAEGKTCCLLNDRNARCPNPATTAAFTRNVQDLVGQNGAQLKEDPTAGHMYICDFHKNYIQKLRIIHPGVPGSWQPGTYVANLAQPFYSSFSPFQPQQHQQPQHPVQDSSPLTQSSSSGPTAPPSSDDNRHEGTVERAESTGRSSVAAQPHHTPDSGSKRKSSTEPVDMRKTNNVVADGGKSNTNRAAAEAESGRESSDEEIQYENVLASSDLLYGIGEIFSFEEIHGYLKHFDIQVSPHATREELSRIFYEHMESVPITDTKSTLTAFFHAVKTDTRAFNQPYKQPLTIDFELSSDEEVLLVDTKSGSQTENISTASDQATDSETEEDEENMDESLPELHFEPDVQRAVNEVNGKLPIAEIERILSKYSLPTKYTHAAQDSDSDSSSAEDTKPVNKRNVVSQRKRQKFRNGGE